MGRTLVIAREKAPLRPYVWLETPLDVDRAYEEFYLTGALVVDHDEAAADPELVDVVHAWDSGDDSAFGIAEGMVDARMILEAAEVDIRRAEGRVQVVTDGIVPVRSGAKGQYHRTTPTGVTYCGLPPERYFIDLLAPTWDDVPEHLVCQRCRGLAPL